MSKFHNTKVDVDRLLKSSSTDSGSEAAPSDSQGEPATHREPAVAPPPASNSRTSFLGKAYRYAVSLLRLNRTRSLVHDSLLRLDTIERRVDRGAEDFALASARLKDAEEALTQTIREQASLKTQVQQIERFQDRIAADVGAGQQRSHAETVAKSSRIAALASNLEILTRFAFDDAGAKSPTARDSTDAKEDAKVGSALLDDFYVALEQRYRGSMEDIAARQAVYLTELETMAQDPAIVGPVLDLGCGRGEWLELLTERKIAASGIDTNAGQLAEARAKGLAVVEGDGLAFMASQPESHYMAVTAFHLVEHIPFDVLAAWFVEIRRILKPGGQLIIETPNPENLIVGAFTFHMDPTHQRPLPSGLLDVLAETVGFDQRSARPLHPHPRLAEALKTMPSEIAYLLYGYQDYGFFARKPSTPRNEP